MSAMVSHLVWSRAGIRVYVRRSTSVFGRAQAVEDFGEPSEIHCVYERVMDASLLEEGFHGVSSALIASAPVVISGL